MFAETDANDIDELENLKDLVDLIKIGAEEKYLIVMNTAMGLNCEVRVCDKS
ncbi:hypothetical protein [Fictibacillus sp. NRS-1165]|uniref:hypothetical protein n=1 Tax=Fictibacillus sp. NRS-1165 TaxID=3144463 RepID=UPI003D1EBE5F